MKKVFLLCMTALLCTFHGFAADFDIQDGVLVKYNGPGGRVTIPSGVIRIGDEAFRHCSLTSVIMPNSVTEIGFYVFGECFGLSSVTFSNSLVSIGYAAFWNCSSLTSVQLPNSLKSIEGGAFYNCDFSSITIPASVTEIGFGAFMSYGELTSIIVNNSNPNYSSENGILYNKNKTALHTYPNGKNGSTFSIPNTVNRIEEDAFAYCSNLTSITIPNSVKSIGESAFFHCDGLTSVTLPNSITEIGGSAFRTCSNLTSITIPNSVTSIGEGVFFACSKLQHIITSTGNAYFLSEGGILYDKNKTRLVAYPAGRSVSFSVPNTVTHIGTAFSGCNVISVTLPNSITKIESSAFINCKNLTSITIPNSVTSIGYGVFMYCPKLKNVSVGWLIPLANMSISAFLDNLNETNISACTLTVPVGTKALYQNVDVWKDFGTIKEQGILASPSLILGERGSFEVSLGVPTDGQFTASFTVQLPAGFDLNQGNTALVEELLNNYQLVITPKGNGNWLFEIEPKMQRSSSAGLYREVVHVAYTVDKSVTDGQYELKINNLNLQLNDGTVIREDEITIAVTFDSVVGNAIIEAANVFCSNGILSVNTPTAEQIDVYSLNGALIYQAQKGVGKATFNLNHLSKGVLIVKGSTGWMRKVVK
jgi:hypothetical protein